MKISGSSSVYCNLCSTIFPRVRSTVDHIKQIVCRIFRRIVAIFCSLNLCNWGTKKPEEPNLNIPLLSLPSPTNNKEVRILPEDTLSNSATAPNTPVVTPSSAKAQSADPTDRNLKNVFTSKVEANGLGVNLAPNSPLPLFSPIKDVTKNCLQDIPSKSATTPNTPVVTPSSGQAPPIQQINYNLKSAPISKAQGDTPITTPDQDQADRFGPVTIEDVSEEDYEKWLRAEQT